MTQEREPILFETVEPAEVEIEDRVVAGRIEQVTVARRQLEALESSLRNLREQCGEIGHTWTRLVKDRPLTLSITPIGDGSWRMMDLDYFAPHMVCTKCGIEQTLEVGELCPICLTGMRSFPISDRRRADESDQIQACLNGRLTHLTWPENTPLSYYVCERCRVFVWRVHKRPRDQ